jgi:hypothetical protein
MTAADASPIAGSTVGSQENQKPRTASYKNYSAVLPDVTTLKLVVRNELYPSASDGFFRGGGS